MRWPERCEDGSTNVTPEERASTCLVDSAVNGKEKMEEYMPNSSRGLSTDDWAFLNTGDRVVLQRPNEIPRPGTIDDVSNDASIIWVWLDGLGRILVAENDEVTFSTEQLAACTYSGREDELPRE